MSMIDVSSTVQAIATPFGEYRFHWTGDHWKQEIDCVGDCSSIPKIWSVEGQQVIGGRRLLAGPSFQHVHLSEAGPKIVVARLDGREGVHTYNAAFRCEERAEEFVVVVEVKVQGAAADELTPVTYLVESSDGVLKVEAQAATLTWPNPETTLVFEVEAPAVLDAKEDGLGTIQLRASTPPGPVGEVRTIRYRWRLRTKPGKQIWDRQA